MATISACLVIRNEEPVIDRCLKSISSLVDEIILIHDGECTDRTIEIARQYTDKIFVRPYIGEAEPHRAFSFAQATGEWLFQIDADEYLDEKDHDRVRALFLQQDIDAFWFEWELWNEKKTIFFPGLQKRCLMRRSAYHYWGIPHEAGWVDGKEEKTTIRLHHRPTYNNISWEHFLRKKRKWAPVHASYYFPHLRSVECFQTTSDGWWKQAELVRDRIVLFLVWQPLKQTIGQLKNGLWRSWYGIIIAIQQYVYYRAVYKDVWKIKRKK